MPPRPASLKVRALQWLAQREHSPQELRGKLLRLGKRANAATPARGCEPAPDAEPNAEPEQSPEQLAAEVDALLAWLSTHGYLSPARFVESRVNARQARFGNAMIRHELQQHGLALDGAAQQALKDSELDRARAVWQRKFGSPAPDAAARVRQMRFLAGRGFAPDVIRRVVRGGSSGDD